jgi:hypothetical protein
MIQAFIFNYTLIFNRDREVNQDTYPALHYPECYLLHEGYKVIILRVMDGVIVKI